MNFSEFLNFDEYVTPMVIKVVYAGGTLLFMVYTLFNIPWSYLDYLGFDDIIIGVLMWLLVLLAFRLYCELMIVMFKFFARVEE
jgi:hypothetical protein|tara:strand:+ start:165 stop:416 length:252 start_codon:yes stop_codon:yes gene_type:complete